MSSSNLDEREFELINIVGAKLASSQRDLSQHMDLSLGMTNMLLRRLVSKGYIRIRQLNKRKAAYLLTPKGFAEKMRKSVKYTLKTIHSIGLINKEVKKIILDIYAKGERNFFILGSSDLGVLIERVLKEDPLQGCVVSYLEQMPEHEVKGVILICKEGVKNGKFNVLNRVDMLTELAKNQTLMV